MGDLEAKWNSAFLANYSTPEIQIVSGKGLELKDSDGKKYLDFVAGIAVSALGHSHPAIVKAIKKQSKLILHTSNLYANEPSLRLAEKLQSLTKRKAKIFFCNSGAEANEAALKLTRLKKSGATLSLLNSFHGRTFGALTLTGQISKHEGFEPLLPGIEYLQANNSLELENYLEREISSIFFEPIQGEGGVIDLKSEYLSNIANLAKSKKASLVADEVQTGMGRCGHWFLSEGLGINPDVIVLAKGLAGGLPIGAIMVFDELAESFKPGSHGSTFGGNPLACAVGLSVIKTIEEENLLQNAKLRGEQLVRNLSGHNLIEKITGAGLLRGVYLQKAVAKDVAKKAQNSGILINAISDSVIRIAPPLVVTRSQVDKASEIISKILDAA